MLFTARAPLSLALLALLPGVSAHGALMKVVIDGKTYKGNGPGGDPSTTIVRPIKEYEVGPVKGASNPDLKCGIDAKNAALSADAKPGSKVEVLWASPDLSHWIHEVGPIMTYMAECTGVSDCSDFDPTDAKWFKIDELGLKDDGTTWWMKDLFDSKTVATTIPKDLKAGNYLFRSEVIALHNALTEGGAEFYPGCAQLKVSGDETGTPSKTVSIPGVYSDTDPGIVVPDIFNPGFKYDFPGGPVATIGGSSGSSSGSDDSSSSSKPTSTKAAASTKAATSTKAAASTESAAAPASTPAGSTSNVGAEPPSSNTSDTSGSSKTCKNKKRDARRSRAIKRHAAGMRAVHRHS